MFEYFKITAANKNDYAQLLWMFRSLQFFPDSLSTPPLPAEPSASFDYRELVKMVANDFNNLSVNVRTRSKYSLIQFGTNVIPTAHWTSRYKLSVAPAVAALNINFDPTELKTTSPYFQSYVYQYYKKVEPVVTLSFLDVGDAPVADPGNVNQWNAFFDLPANGEKFSSATIDGNDVKLSGGSDITINESLFANDINLTGISDPNGSIVYFEDNCFNNCPALENVVLHGVTTIDSIGAFVDCIELKMLRMHNLETTNSDSICGNNPELTVLDIPKIKILAGYGFYGLTAVTSVSFPLLHTIDRGGIGGMGITVANSTNFPALTTIGQSGFEGMPSLTTVNLPLVTSIGIYAFYGSEQMTTVIMNAVTTIDDSAFNSCTGLQTIQLGSCTNLGTTTGNNNVFYAITGKTITLTIKTALMTANAGNPDGDIVQLQTDNTVTVIQV